MKIKLILAKAFFLLLIYGCTKPCDIKSGNEGIIISNLSEDNFSCWNLKTDRFLITTDSAYKSVFGFDSTSISCSEKTLEEIDFSKYSLLGMYANEGGCDVGFHRKATRNDAEKKIIYEVDAQGCGQCDMMGLSYNLVLIPKVPDNYTAEFILK